jgi:hypothetical protein
MPARPGQAAGTATADGVNAGRRRGDVMTTDPGTTESDLRQRAISQLRKRREFAQHLAVYAVVNLVLNLIWLFTTPDGFYWPMFPLLIWGIGLVFHALDAFSSVFSPEPPPEEKVQREITRLTRR